MELYEDRIVYKICNDKLFGIISLKKAKTKK